MTEKDGYQYKLLSAKGSYPRKYNYFETLDKSRDMARQPKAADHDAHFIQPTTPTKDNTIVVIPRNTSRKS